MDILKELLKLHWGFSSFRPNQQEAIEAILSGRDSLTVLPTGGGKSLCYQLPSLRMEGLTIVVSPLISLMKDQVDDLRAMGLPARRLTSGMEPDEAGETWRALDSGELKLLYVSPERIVQPGFLARLAARKVNFLAVDEAHCISHWGHDFRPEYRQLAGVRRALGAPCHAFTATATERVRLDIVKQLELRDPAVILGIFDRPNLIYRFARRALSPIDEVHAVIKRHPGEAGIIYCITRRAVDELTVSLNARGVPALGYHAGMDAAARTRAQDDFMSERCNLIVATVAFGMGVDRPDVRFVIHAGLPKSVEHYQQESGRAGRDGLPAECCLFYNYEDFKKWEYLLEKAESPAPGEDAPPAAPRAAPPDISPQEAREIALHLLREMYNFAEKSICRHRYLAGYFGQEYPKPSCLACDICLNEREEAPDSQTIALKILSAVVRTGERFGGQYVAETLKGVSNGRIIANQHDQLSTFGLLAGETLRAIRSFIEQLESQGFLAQEKAGDYPVYRVTPAGWRLLRQRDLPVRLILPAKTASGGRRKKDKREFARTYLEPAHVSAGLFQALRKARARIARKRHLPPYIVCGDKTLLALAERRPRTIEELLEVHGFGKRKAEQFGEALIAAIAAWEAGCAEEE